MNFDDAIKAHSDWKLKLKAYLRNPDKTLRGAEVCLDNRCELGKWIHGTGAKHAALTEFKELKTSHARFHKAAAAIVDKANAGEKVSDDTSLGSKSEFSEVSQQVVSNIMALKRSLASAA